MATNARINARHQRYASPCFLLIDSMCLALSRIDNLQSQNDSEDHNVKILLDTDTLIS